MTERDLINQFPDATRKHKEKEPKESFDDRMLKEYGPDDPQFGRTVRKEVLYIALAIMAIATCVAGIIAVIIKTH